MREEKVEQVVLDICPKCGSREVVASKSNPKICKSCAAAAQKRSITKRQIDKDWIEEAKEAGVDVWERQPRETDTEYAIWSTYRDSYPGKPMTRQQLAEAVGVGVSTVNNAFRRWNFPMRMQAWQHYCDAATVAMRRQDIVDMYQKQIGMAAELNEKIAEAIHNIDPYNLKPSELNSLLKTATELERKARVDAVEQERIRRDEVAMPGESKEVKQRTTKKDDLKEVLGVLAGAGVLDGVTVKTTQTVEVKPMAVTAGDGTIIDVEEVKDES